MAHDSLILSCQFHITRLQNFDFAHLPGDGRGNIFIRYYIPAGRGRRIRMDTREIPSTTHDPKWNEVASVQILGAADRLGEVMLLRPGCRDIVFELRWRSCKSTVFGGIPRSKLLGKGEVSWKEVMDSSIMSIEKRIVLAPNTVVLGPSTAGTVRCRLTDDCKPPALLVGMEVAVVEARGERREMRRKECECRDCGWEMGSDEDMLALACMVESLM